MCAALKHHERIAATAMGAQCHKSPEGGVDLATAARQFGSRANCGSGLLRHDTATAYPPCEIALHIKATRSSRRWTSAT